MRACESEDRGKTVNRSKSVDVLDTSLIRK